MSVLIPAAAKLAGPVQRLIAMGIDAGIKPGELYTPRCRLAEVRRVASEQRSEAQKGRSRLREPARYDAALILCTVATPTPTVLAVRSIPTPSLSSLRTFRSSWSTRGRPSFFP